MFSLFFYALVQLVEKYKIAVMFFCQMLNSKCTIVIYYGVNRVVDFIEKPISNISTYLIENKIRIIVSFKFYFLEKTQKKPSFYILITEGVPCIRLFKIILKKT